MFDFQNNVCFEAVSLTKSDPKMHMEKFIALVFEKEPLWDQTKKGYENQDLCRQFWMDVAEELN
jgi:hypothetical protein